MSIEEIKEILINYYEDTDKGCFINGKWLSIDEIIKVLKRYY